MNPKPHSRFSIVLSLIHRFLGKFNPSIEVPRHEIYNSSEYLDLRVKIPKKNAIIEIREYVKLGEVGGLRILYEDK